MNPFDNEHYVEVSYTDFVLKQVNCLDVGESTKINLGHKSLVIFRTTLRYAAKKLHNATFATRENKDGLWVKRVK